MRKMKVAITCLICVDEAIGLEIASLLLFFPELNLDGSLKLCNVCLLFSVYGLKPPASIMGGM